MSETKKTKTSLTGTIGSGIKTATGGNISAYTGDSLYKNAESGYSTGNQVKAFENNSALANQWNSDLYSGLTKGNDGNYYTKNNNKVYFSTDANGAQHYSVKGQDAANALSAQYNSLGNNATYSLNGANYSIAQPDQQQGFSVDRSGIMSEAEGYARDLEKIKSYYDTYLPAMMNAGKAAADKAYEANSNSAYNTWKRDTKGAKENYIRDSANKQNELQQARDAYVSSRNNIGKDSFSATQQGRENAALRGLSNSGLMQALDQNTINKANEARAQIDSQYNQNVAKLNNEINTLVQTYGLDKKTADDIYNNTLQSLEAQRQDEYTKVVNESQQKAIEYQFGVDSFNAKAYNDASSQLANIAADTWKTKVQAETDYAIADLQAKNSMSIAEMQDATDRYIAKADNDTKKWLAKFDRKTQMIITNLNGDIQKELARISGSYGVAAATQAASIAASADRYNMKVTAAMGTLTDIADKNGWDDSTYAGALNYVANGDTEGLQKYIENNPQTRG